MIDLYNIDYVYIILIMFITASQPLTLVSKSMVTISFTIIGLFNAEMLPTLIRKVGVSVASFIGTTGGMLSPYIVQLASTVLYLTYVKVTL